MADPAAALTEIVPVPARGRVHEESARAGVADVAPSGRVRLDAIARWLQEAGWHDVEDAGLTGLATWVARRTRIRVDRFPRFDETVRVRTFCSGVGRMWAERRTSIAGADGAVEAVALWIHLDPSSGRPTPFAERELAVWGETANGRQVKARLRHRAPGRDAARAPWHFRATDLDVLGHVNNAVYWAIVEEELAGGADPEVVDAEIEFRTPAPAGEAVLLREPGCLWVAAPGGELHASVAFAAAPESR